jgi:dihydrofolate reductase
MLETIMGIISITSFVSLDGVMQSGGSPTEDASGGFKHGGWFIPFADETFGGFIVGILERTDALLLGRNTYEIFASYWPKVTDPNDPVAASLNKAHKHVVTTRGGLSWGPATAVSGELASEIKKLKASFSGELQVHGSARLARSLLEAGLVEVLNLVVAPVILGEGKRLFGAKDAGAWSLVSSQKTGSGLLLNRYERAGEIQHATAPAPR